MESPEQFPWENRPIKRLSPKQLETAIADAISKASESDYRVTVVSIEYGDNCLKDECRLVLDVAVPISSFGFTESETQNK